MEVNIADVTWEAFIYPRSDIRARQKAGRNTVILRLSRLGWPQEQIAEIAGMTQGRVAQIINNTNFGEINNLLSQGRDMDYIASHYRCPGITPPNSTKPKIQRGLNTIRWGYPLKSLKRH